MENPVNTEPSSPVPLSTQSSENVAPENSAAPPSDRPPSSDRKSAVEEARKYRKRAQSAERSLEQANQQISAMELEIKRYEQDIRTLTAESVIKEALHRLDVLDVAQAKQLVLAQLKDEELTADRIQKTVQDIYESEPQLFRKKPRFSGVMGAKTSDSESRDSRLDIAAVNARDTGHLHDVLRYQQIKRRVMG